MLSLSAMEWESGNIQASFEEYVKKRFPSTDTTEVLKDVRCQQMAVFLTQKGRITLGLFKENCYMKN